MWGSGLYKDTSLEIYELDLCVLHAIKNTKSEQQLVILFTFIVYSILLSFLVYCRPTVFVRHSAEHLFLSLSPAFSP